MLLKGSLQNLTNAAAAMAGGSACAGVALAVCERGLQWPAPWAWVAACGASSLVALGFVLPVVGIARRASARLISGVADAASGSGPVALRGSWPVSGVGSELERAIGVWAQKRDALAARLREAEVRLNVSDAERRHGEAILNSLRDAVLVTDAFNELTIANEPASRLLGFDIGDAAHKPIDSVVEDQTLRKLIKEVRQSGVVSKQKRIEHTMDAGAAAGAAPGRQAFDVTIACLPDPKQQGVGGVVTILRDITREKEINQMKSDFVSQASHELRTPLSSINAYIEMLLDEEVTDDAQRREFYTIIKSEADRVTRMIDNMLNISRIEAGIVQVERSEVDFAKVVREVIETMQPQARAKSIMLIEKAGPLIYTAEADRDMMYQVVMNLVSNAIKYTPENGRVTVAVENDDASRAVLVSITDTGLGIPPDALGKLFEKFYRIENYKRIAKGTGLGLNLVKHIVETVHHGKVGVSSEVGMGSRFWFTVPYEFQGG